MIKIALLRRKVSEEIEMEMISTAIFMATNFYLLYQVYYFFKKTQEVRDEVEEKNKIIRDLKDQLRQKNDRRNVSKK